MSEFAATIEFIRSLYPGKEFIPLHEPRFVGNERKYVLDAIDSTFVSSVGAYVDRFEVEMQAYTGSRHAIAVVNGTAALHMALMLAGVKRGELVVTQALSFIATCNAISYIGAEPYFIDVDPARLGMGADALERFLNDVRTVGGESIHVPTGKRVAACVPMHTFGLAVDIERITALCARAGIPLIEDAAESIGTKVNGRHTGTFGLMGTFSFNGNKTVTCGGGGIIVTDDPDLAKMAKHLTTQAKVPHRWEFVHDHVGYNYRCPNLNAAFACAQLEKLDAFVADKRNTAAAYHAHFATSPWQSVPEALGTRSNYWLNAVQLRDREERDRFLIATNDSGVMTRPVWALMSRLSMFASCMHDGLEASQDIENCLVNVPSSVRF